MRLKGKNIVLGVTGSIAAYKSAMLLRLLVKEGAEVQVVMTDAGKQFITPVTMSALSGRAVVSEFFSNTDGTWHSHVDMGQWADLMLVAPVTASSIGKMVNGIADNLLTTTYLSAKNQVMHAPAMDLDMYKHPSTQRNIEALKSFGDIVIEPDDGVLASGLMGKGRMAEPEHIVDEVVKYFNATKSLVGKTFMVTAGPTQEKIDPVRYISNYSTGKMGYAIAEELAEKGATVKLISGPVAIQASHPNIELIKVVSAEEMKKASLEQFADCHGAVMCAAVADYKPQTAADAKIKRESQAELNIELTRNDDIAQLLGENKKDNQLLVGFALETNDGEANAIQKLSKKNLDLIVLNSLEDSGAGFGTDTNKITIIGKNGLHIPFQLKEKTEVAKDIVQELIKHMN